MRLDLVSFIREWNFPETLLLITDYEFLRCWVICTYFWIFFSSRNNCFTATYDSLWLGILKLFEILKDFPNIKFWLKFFWLPINSEMLQGPHGASKREILNQLCSFSVLSYMGNLVQTHCCLCQMGHQALPSVTVADKQGKGFWVLLLFILSLPKKNPLWE